MMKTTWTALEIMTIKLTTRLKGLMDRLYPLAKKQSAVAEDENLLVYPDSGEGSYELRYHYDTVDGDYANVLRTFMDIDEVVFLYWSACVRGILSEKLEHKYGGIDRIPNTHDAVRCEIILLFDLEEDGLSLFWKIPGQYGHPNVKKVAELLHDYLANGIIECRTETMANAYYELIALTLGRDVAEKTRYWCCSPSEAASLYEQLCKNSPSLIQPDGRLKYD